MKSMKATAFIACLLGISSASMAAESNSDSASFYLQKAQQQQTERRYGQAEENYLKAVGFQPQNSSIYQSLGKYYLEVRKYSEALPVYERLYKLEPNNTEILSQLANLSFNLKKFEDATRYFEVLKAKPDFNDADAVKLGKAYLQNEDYGKAISAFEVAFKKNDQNAEAAYQLGRAYVETSNYKKAIEFYNKAIALQPTKHPWMFELGIVYFNSQDYNNAATTFEKAAAAGMPRTSTYLENLGMAQVSTEKDQEKGIAALEELLVKKPNDQDVLFIVAQTWYRLGKYDKAIESWQRVRNVDESNYRALYMQGMAFQKMGKVDKGRQICDEAISKDNSLAKLRQEKFQF